MYNKKMTYNGMSFENKKGKYIVTADHGAFKDTFTSFGDATEWLYEMADNHDIGNTFVQRICDTFKCNVSGK